MTELTEQTEPPEPVDVTIPPILGCVFGVPILVVALWFFLGFYRAPSLVHEE